MSRDEFNCPPSLSFNDDDDAAIMSGFHSSMDFNPDDLQGELREEFGMDIDIPFADHSLMNSETDFELSFKSSGDGLDTILSSCTNEEEVELQESASSVASSSSDKIPNVEPADTRTANDAAGGKQFAAKGGKKRSLEPGDGPQNTKTKTKAAAKKTYNIRGKQAQQRGASQLSEPAQKLARKAAAPETEDDEEFDDDEDGEDEADEEEIKESFIVASPARATKAKDELEDSDAKEEDESDAADEEAEQEEEVEAEVKMAAKSKATKGSKTKPTVTARQKAARLTRAKATKKKKVPTATLR